MTPTEYRSKGFVPYRLVNVGGDRIAEITTYPYTYPLSSGVYIQYKFPFAKGEVEAECSTIKIVKSRCLCGHRFYPNVYNHKIKCPDCQRCYEFHGISWQSSGVNLSMDDNIVCHVFVNCYLPVVLSEETGYSVGLENHPPAVIALTDVPSILPQLSGFNEFRIVRIAGGDND